MLADFTHDGSLSCLAHGRCEAAVAPEPVSVTTGSAQPITIDISAGLRHVTANIYLLTAIIGRCLQPVKMS
jgi:hypothetical protein